MELSQCFCALQAVLLQVAQQHDHSDSSEISLIHLVKLQSETFSVNLERLTIKPPLSCEESRKQLQLDALNKPQKGIKKKTGSDIILPAVKEI